VIKSTTGGLIRIIDVSILLGYKQNRTTVRWCLINGVKVYSHHGTRRKFVLAEKLEWAWIGRFQCEIGLNQINFVNPLQDTAQHDPTGGNNDIIIELQHEKYYLARLQKRISEL